MSEKDQNNIIGSGFVICIFIAFGAFSSQLITIGKYLKYIWGMIVC